MGELSDLAAMPLRVRLRARLVAETMVMIGGDQGIKRTSGPSSTASSHCTRPLPLGRHDISHRHRHRRKQRSVQELFCSIGEQSATRPDGVSHAIRDWSLADVGCWPQWLRTPWITLSPDPPWFPDNPKVKCRHPFLQPYDPTTMAFCAPPNSLAVPAVPRPLLLLLAPTAAVGALSVRCRSSCSCCPA